MNPTLDLIAALTPVALAAAYLWRRWTRKRAANNGGKDCGGCGRCS